MGNAPALCRSECCCEEEKSEVDMNVASYSASTSYINKHASNSRMLDLAEQVSSLPTQSADWGGQDGAKTPIWSEPESNHPLPHVGQHDPSRTGGRSTPPQSQTSLFGAATPEQGMLASPPMQSSEEHRDQTPQSVGRTAADWLLEQNQFADLATLPEGWIRAKSRSNDEVYYCCVETGETTFVEPTAAQAVNKNAPLPDGWVEMQSRSNGKIYFWNTLTETSQFEKPVASALNNAQANLQAASDDDGPLPEGWASMASRKTGKSYYFHAQTQTSQFDRPTGPPNGVDPEP